MKRSSSFKENIANDKSEATKKINHTNTNASKTSINTFKNSLVSYETELRKIKANLQNSQSIRAYETSSEARRKSQLKTEETIASFKVDNGFKINDDESVLPPELQLEIESIQKTNYALIEQTESYEQNLISESESNETKIRVNEMLAELDEKINVAVDLIDHLGSGILKEKEKLKTTKQELNIKSSLEAINEKISLLPFNAKQVDFAENKHDKAEIGEMIIKETISLEKLHLFKFKELEIFDSFTIPSRIFEILENGTYVVGGFVTSTRKSHLFIYDPIMKTKSRELIIKNKIHELITFKNKIVYAHRKYRYYSSGYSFVLNVLDENLNLIKKANTEAILSSVDESHLYCIYRGKQVELFDWDLNRLKTDVAFQVEDSEKNFFLNTFTARIDQFVKRDNKYILNFQTQTNQPPNQLLIFNELGVLLKEHKSVDGHFVLDSNNNVIVNNARNDLICYYDCNGNLFKTVSYKRPKNFKSIIKQLKIDSVDNIYFGQ